MNVNSLPFKNKIVFKSSLRYELFFALSSLIDKESNLHSAWKKHSYTKLSSEFRNTISDLGESPELWPLFGSILPPTLTNPSFNEILDYLDKMELTEFQAGLLKGILHDEKIARSIVEGSLTLKGAINQLPSKKKEWLGHVGLFPYSTSSPIVKALQLLIAHPTLFKRMVLFAVKEFWLTVFQESWKSLSSQMNHSINDSQSLLPSLPFEIFAERRLLKVMFNSSGTTISALRGGYELKINTIQQIIFSPSIFNERRLWSSLPIGNDKHIVYFPYLDYSISLEKDRKLSTTASKIDPAMVFRALGDPTRYAIIKLLANQLFTPSELADQLDVTKATITHHLSVLRESHLIEYEKGSRSAAIEINYDTIGAISAEYAKYLNPKKISSKVRIGT